MKKVSYFLSASMFLLMTVFPQLVGATMGEIGIKQPGSGVQVGGRSATELLTTVLKNTITLVFASASVAVVLIFLWGALDWILSAGDKEKISGARKKMVSSVVGLLLLSLTFVILQVIGQITSFNILGDITLPKFGEVQPTKP